MKIFYTQVPPDMTVDDLVEAMSLGYMPPVYDTLEAAYTKVRAAGNDPTTATDVTITVAETAGE